MSGSVKDIDHGWKNIKRELKRFKGSFVKIGVLEDAGAEENGVNMADVASYNEFGTSRIPARPFMGQTFDKNLEDARSKIEKLKNQVADGKSGAKEALDVLGVWYTGKVKETFTKGEFAPNAPSTIKIKGPGGRPLIRYGHLRNSINHKTEMK